MMYAIYSQMGPEKKCIKMGKRTPGKECSYTQTIKHMEPRSVTVNLYNGNMGVLCTITATFQEIWNYFQKIVLKRKTNQLSITTQWI